jgi:hypothetical protein
VAPRKTIGGSNVVAPRAKRDTYLGAAALLLGICQFAYVLRHGIEIDLLHDMGRWAIAAYSVGICRCLAIAVGLAFVGLGFLGASEARARRVRTGACCIAVGYLLGVMGLTLYNFPDPLGRMTHIYHGYQLVRVAAGLLGMLAGLCLAWAFSTKVQLAYDDRARARNRRLAWAGVFYTLNAALWIVIHMLYENEWRFWFHGLTGIAGMEVYLLARMAGDVLWLVAAAVATVGFFRASRSNALDSAGQLGRRERLLALTSALVVLSVALFAVGTVSAPWPGARPFTSWKTAAWWWIFWLEGLEFVLPGIMAAIGLSSSRSRHARPAEHVTGHSSD